MTTSNFTDKVCKCISQQEIPPRFNPNIWNVFFGNCYLYALRLEMDCFGLSNLTRPGFLSGKDCVMSQSVIIENFISDCNALGLIVEAEKLKESYDIPQKNQYRIAVYLEPDYILGDMYYIDYHFLRQDDDGLWSARAGWGGKIERHYTIRDMIDEDYYLKGVFKITKNEG